MRNGAVAQWFLTRASIAAPRDTWRCARTFQDITMMGHAVGGGHSSARNSFPWRIVPQKRPSVSSIEKLRSCPGPYSGGKEEGRAACGPVSQPVARAATTSWAAARSMGKCSGQCTSKCWGPLRVKRLHVRHTWEPYQIDLIVPKGWTWPHPSLGVHTHWGASEEACPLLAAGAQTMGFARIVERQRFLLVLFQC